MKKNLIKIACAVMLLSINYCWASDKPLLYAQAQDQALAQAQEAQTTVKPEPPKQQSWGDKTGIRQIEVLTGFGHSKIKEKGNYNLVPIIVDLDYNLKDLTKKIGFNPPVLLQFQLEPYISAVVEPNSNVELGNSFMFKVGLVPETWKLQPFVKAGAGFCYTSQHTREQSTQFNFIETGVVGFHYFFNKDSSIILEGRIRHLSNAGIDQPNHGINSYFGIIGISRKF